MIYDTFMVYQNIVKACFFRKCLGILRQHVQGGQGKSKQAQEEMSSGKFKSSIGIPRIKLRNSLMLR